MSTAGGPRRLLLRWVRWLGTAPIRDVRSSRQRYFRMT